MTVALANQDWWLGAHEDARRRLHVALGDLPAQPSPDRIRLRLALALTALGTCDLHDALGQTIDARDDARALGEPVFEAAALAGGALGGRCRRRSVGCGAGAEEAADAFDRLDARAQATRLPALWMLARARRYLGHPGAAADDLARGAAAAAGTGRERVALIITLESVAVLVALGRLAEATAAGEEGLELARLGATCRT